MELFSDPSAFAAGCFVRQLQDGKWVPLAYGSFSFSAPERNYDTYKRELKALVSFRERGCLNDGGCLGKDGGAIRPLQCIDEDECSGEMVMSPCPWTESA